MIAALIEKIVHPFGPPELTGEPEVRPSGRYIHDMFCTCEASRCYGRTNKNFNRHLEREEFDG